MRRLPRFLRRYERNIVLNSSFYVRDIKRILDVVLSLLGIVLAAIPILILSIMIFIGDRGPVFFTQTRVGRNGRTFELYKLRTMRVGAPHHCATAEFVGAEQYITRIGAVLRKTSLDELPQLFNVLRGDMSLVGPRPLIEEESGMHAERMRLGIYNLRPGLTGLAQVHGRDRVSNADKIIWDQRYLERCSFALDAKIVAKTVVNVVRGLDVIEGEVRGDEASGLNRAG